MTKLWYKSKTIWWNIATLAAAIASMVEFVAVLPEAWAPWVLLAGALGNIYLRSITEDPIKLK